MKSQLIENEKDVIIAVVGLFFIIIGVAGNLLVIIAVKRKRNLRSTTNYLLVNLAISDITNMTFLPLMIIQSHVAFHDGPLADFLCKFFLSYHVPLSASFVSILTILVLAVERYYAIVKPMREGVRLREETVRYAIIAVWIIGFTVTLPFYIYGKYHENQNDCRFTKLPTKTVSIYVISVQVIFVFLPFIVITFCYFQIIRNIYSKNSVGPQNVQARQEALERMKLVKLSLSITISFAVCFLPMCITLFFRAIDENKYDKKYYGTASILYFLESALNPMLYALQSTNFRQAFKEMFKCQ